MRRKAHPINKEFEEQMKLGWRPAPRDLLGLWRFTASMHLSFSFDSVDLFLRINRHLKHALQTSTLEEIGVYRQASEAAGRRARGGWTTATAAGLGGPAESTVFARPKHWRRVNRGTKLKGLSIDESIIWVPNNDH